MYIAEKKRPKTEGFFEMKKEENDDDRSKIDEEKSVPVCSRLRFICDFSFLTLWNILTGPEV